MAAYGALVSVMQIIDQLHRHPLPPISLHKQHFESLTANVGFLQEFLEGYNPHVSYTSEADPLESRIAEAAYTAEDVIENYIVDQIHARITDHGGNSSSIQFYQGLEKVIDEMDVIKTEIIAKNMKMEGVQIIKKHSTTDDAAGSFQSGSSTAHKVTTMVGLDEVLYEMLDKITGGACIRQIIPIVGMGGLGKTTLARNIYAHQLVKEHFDICAWSTISQAHNSLNILTEILSQVGLGDGGDLSEGELGEKLYKYLMGRRYLIVMDDMWSIEAWDRVRSFFPDNGNGSRVVVTTRLSNLASKFDCSDGLDMKLLDEATSWNLICKTVFGDEICPIELEDVGKKIVKGCRGLPLSTVVAGGLLLKSKATRENWQVIEENLTSIVNAEDHGSCLQILYTSYNNLPVHIKPCFLYLGIFNEDEEIEVDILNPLMVAEGFIKPIDGKSLDEAGEEYLEQLIDRNLVLVGERDLDGKLESFKVHDLLRDLCLREARKEKFFCLSMQSTDISQGGQRRITKWPYGEENSTSSAFLVQYVEAANVRSLIGKFSAQILPISRFRLLRVYMVRYEEESSNEYYEEILIRLLNLRFLVVGVVDEEQLPKIPSHLWNLQTLIFLLVDEDYILEIWNMPLLRLAMTDPPRCLSDPPPDDEVIVLENLHILVEVRNLKLSEEVLKRIPNIRILYLYYNEKQDGSKSESEKDEKKKGDYYSFKNLHRFNKLQDLRLTWRGSDSPSVQELCFSHSLKHLTLKGTKLPWEEMASKIGWLPLLQVLQLIDNALVGSEWETVEGQFSSLKYLKIHYCSNLEYWITDDNAHFPRLERLVRRGLSRLREIPSCIGDIPTLRSIRLVNCSDSAVDFSPFSQRTIILSTNY